MSRTKSGPSQGVVAAIVVLVAMVVIGVAVLVGLRLSGGSLGKEASTGPLVTSTKESSTRTSRTSRPSPTTTRTTTVTTRRAAECSAQSINSDLGYPASGARIIDCGGGWAVMASEHSGDPFWVTFRGGRWVQASNISMYLMTCPDAAIAQGAPSWMANKHLPTCRTSSSRPRTTERTTRPSTRTPTPTPGTSPGPGPTPTQVPTTSSSTSSSTSQETSPPITATDTTEDTTTTLTSASDSAADTGGLA